MFSKIGIYVHKLNVINVSVVEEFDFFYRKGSENEFLNNYIEYKPQFSKQI